MNIASYAAAVTAHDTLSLEDFRLYRDLVKREEEIRRIETELAHANRVAMMGQLTASIAHEIRQPLAAAVINADAAIRWLSASDPNLEEVQRALTRIKKEGARASVVIDRVRALVKKAPAREECVDVNAAIHEVLALTGTEAAKHNVLTIIDLQDALPFVFGDRVQLQQVILNLMINAIEAMSTVRDAPLELSITTRWNDLHTVLIAVCDTGPGIDCLDSAQLFEPFYSTKVDGMGMGLSICRTIAQAHGGTVQVKTNFPRGLTFILMLPVGELRVLDTLRG